MARQPRIQYEGAVYHVMSRGNDRKPIFFSDRDRFLFLRTLAQMTADYGVLCYAWVLMGNHYHLLLETPNANLSAAIRHLNGVYTQKINKRHLRVGHLLQGRYKAMLVEKGPYLLELCRYVVLNPVRAKMVSHPRKWKWSSYRTTAGIDKKEGWCSTDWVLGQFGEKGPRAQRAYRKFVLARVVDPRDPWMNMREGIGFGSENFQLGIRAKLETGDPEIPAVHGNKAEREPEDLIERVGRVYGMAVDRVTARTHRPNEARDVGMYLLRKRARLRLRMIAERFGVKYSAAGNRICAVQKRMEKDTEFRAKVENIK